MSSDQSAESGGPGESGRSGRMAADGLPPALASMWRLCKLGWVHEPRLAVSVVLLTLVAALPDALFALWLAFLADALVEGRGTVVALSLTAVAASATLTWLLSVSNDRLNRRFRDRVTIALEAHVAGLLARVPGLEHQERSEYLDRLAVLRTQVFVLDHMYMSVLNAVGWIVRVGITVVLLVGISPWLVLLVAFAVPTVVSSSRRPGVERQVEERYAEHARLGEHLFATATSPAAGKEVRVLGIGSELGPMREAQWRRWYGPVSRARWATARSYALAWAVFGLGYVGAVVYVAVGLAAPVGSVLLILAAGARLSAYVGATVGEIGFLRGVWLDGARRLAWLEDYAASAVADADEPVPTELHRGIDLQHVSFRYPGSDRYALEDVSLLLPPGAVVAVVGENGAGKSTLVKLLAKLYEPSSGTIAVDGRPLARMQPDAWRARLTGAFQDFFRFEFAAQRSVGLGDLPRLDDRPAVQAAVERAGATDVLDRLPDGLDSQLGPTWPDGQELSFGQWQKVALSRGYLRERPLLMILDEPTAALDAETEHELFERYADAARRSGPTSASAPDAPDGGTAVGGGAGVAGADQVEGRGHTGVGPGAITVLVSHRFSTVRMADLIVVLDGSRLAEVGSHDELMARDGTYAELYRIQADAYR